MDNRLLCHSFGDIRREMHQILDGFNSCFGSRNYNLVNPVNISSKVDKSVDLVGSHISVLKPYLEVDEALHEGLYIIQPCIRTRSLPTLMIDDIQPMWGTFFRNLGVLVHPSRAKELMFHTLEYLIEYANIPREELVLQVSSEDMDLLYYTQLQEKEGVHVECDAMPINCYRHTLGMEGVSGRNFNYSVRQNGRFFDLGNFILLEKNGNPLAIEVGLGNTSILKAKLNLIHVCLAEPLSLNCEQMPEIKPKMFDALIASIHLLSEGIKPSSIKSCNRTLRTLLKGIVYFANKCKISGEDIVESVVSYEMHYRMNNIASLSMLGYLMNFGINKIRNAD